MRPRSTTTAAGRNPSGVATRLETKTCAILKDILAHPLEVQGKSVHVSMWRMAYNCVPRYTDER